MDIPKQQYSTVKKGSKTTVQYSIEETTDWFKNIADVVPNPDYYPWYHRRLHMIGKKRFFELVQKARAGSDKPAVLFKWMLKNPNLVR